MKKGFKSGFGGLFFIMLVIALPAKSQGIPVIDATSIYNLGLQLTTLKEQFDNMQANTRTPETYLWAEVQQSMNQLIQLSNAISMIRGQYGGVDQILSRFQNYAYYRVSPCISAQAVCDDAAWKSILQGQLVSTDIQKKANDALLRGIDYQENQIPLDAQHLQILQEKTSTATGRMEAIQYANQLAAHQANQLLQLRQLMVSHYTVEEAKTQAENDKKALQQAAKEVMTKRLSPQQLPQGKSWRVSDRF